MIESLDIRRENVEAHIDIDVAMIKHCNKWFHFELRYSSGKIVDFLVREFISYEEDKR